MHGEGLPWACHGLPRSDGAEPDRGRHAHSEQADALVLHAAVQIERTGEGPEQGAVAVVAVRRGARGGSSPLRFLRSGDGEDLRISPAGGLRCRPSLVTLLLHPGAPHVAAARAAARTPAENWRRRRRDGGTHGGGRWRPRTPLRGALQVGMRRLQPPSPQPLRRRTAHLPPEAVLEIAQRITAAAGQLGQGDRLVVVRVHPFQQALEDGVPPRHRRRGVVGIQQGWPEQQGQVAAQEVLQLQRRKGLPLQRGHLIQQPQGLPQGREQRRAAGILAAVEKGGAVKPVAQEGSPSSAEPASAAAVAVAASCRAESWISTETIDPVSHSTSQLGRNRAVRRGANWTRFPSAASTAPPSSVKARVTTSGRGAISRRSGEWAVPARLSPPTRRTAGKLVDDPPRDGVCCRERDGLSIQKRQCCGKHLEAPSWALERHTTRDFAGFSRMSQGVDDGSTPILPETERTPKKLAVDYAKLRCDALGGAAVGMDQVKH